MLGLQNGPLTERNWKLVDTHSVMKIFPALLKVPSPFPFTSLPFLPSNCSNVHMVSLFCYLELLVFDLSLPDKHSIIHKTIDLPWSQLAMKIAQLMLQCHIEHYFSCRRKCFTMFLCQFCSNKQVLATLLQDFLFFISLPPKQYKISEIKVFGRPSTQNLGGAL